MEKKLKLRVVDGLIEDMGKGIVRVDSDELASIGCTNGDVIEIEGPKKKTVAKVMGAFADRAKQNLIQMDRTIRENAGVGLDESVTVKKTLFKEAKVVVLLPLDPSKTYDTEGQMRSIKRLTIGLPLVPGDKVSIKLFGSTEEGFIVEGAAPRGPIIVKRETEIRIKAADYKSKNAAKVSYGDIGGLVKEIQKVREIVELPMKYPDLFRQLGIEAPKGILMHGPPGTGKTLIARAVAAETNVNFITVNGPEIMHKYYGESEAKLREVFDLAKKKAPSIVFIDEIDAVAPKRTEVHGDVEKRVVAQLLALMDGLSNRGEIIVIGATNIPDAVDGALRRPGRFDREIIINAPDKNGRLEILKIHTRGMKLADDVSLERLAQSTHGFVGADLANLTKEAGMSALRRLLPKLELGQDTNEDIILEVNNEDFNNALTEAEPSATREFFFEIPHIGWDDVGGLDSIKEKLIQLVEWPLKYSELFNRVNMNTPQGILLTGPTGTGKTLIAKALAKESQVNFIPVSSSMLHSKWQGEAEKTMHDVFRKARQASPCILFFDEIESIASKRSGKGEVTAAERLVSQFLTEIDGLDELNGVIVLAATNRIDMIDPALLRPGRFDYIIEFSDPNYDQRVAIFKVHLKGKPIADDVDIERFAKLTDGMNGSDIDGICKKAVLLAIGDFINAGYDMSDEDVYKELIIRAAHLEAGLAEVQAEKIAAKKVE